MAAMWSKSHDEIAAVHGDDGPDWRDLFWYAPGMADRVRWAEQDAEEASLDWVNKGTGEIQTIINELSGEKVDIILWDENPEKFITNALSPAKVVEVTVDEGTRQARVTVKDDQLSLAIGRGGQNVRLASRLTGWKIDIMSDGSKTEPIVAETAAPAETEIVTPEVVETATPEATVEKPVKEKKIRKSKNKKSAETETAAPIEETPEKVEA